jgi:prepilin-type processing-associated H-X9-DG protein
MGRQKRNEQGGLMAKDDALECMTPKRFATQGRQEMDGTFLPTLGHKEGASMPKRPTKPFSDAWNNIPPNNFPLTPSFNDGRKQGVRSAAYVCPWAVAPGLPLAQVEDAAGTLMVMDTGDGQTSDGRRTYANMDLWSENYTDYGPYPYVANRHQDGFNALFVDGHAKWQKHGSTKARMWTIQSD